MPKKLLCPEDVRSVLAGRFASRHRGWLLGEGTWPLVVPLGTPTEKDVSDDPAGIRAWVEAWDVWQGSGELAWDERQWGRLGRQRLPARLSLATPAQVADAVGEARRWGTAARRHAGLVERWPAIGSGSARNFDVLADYDAADFERLHALLGWLDRNPSSGRLLRQLPVEGVDTKWVEQRRGLVTDLVHALRGNAGERDFHALCGLSRPPHRLRVRVLCPALRRNTGGLRDIEAPAQEIAALSMEPQSVLIVENLETGVALPDIPGCVALMKLGHAVGVLGDLPWLRGIPAVYWGDIDTHGFAILGRARDVLPGLRSVLMDEATLLEHRALWGHEPVQHPQAEASNLTADERAVVAGLRANTWGNKVRLEQERVPWEPAMAKVLEAVGPAASGRAGQG